MQYAGGHPKKRPLVNNCKVVFAISAHAPRHSLMILETDEVCNGKENLSDSLVPSCLALMELRQVPSLLEVLFETLDYFMLRHIHLIGSFWWNGHRAHLQINKYSM